MKAQRHTRGALSPKVSSSGLLASLHVGVPIRRPHEADENLRHDVAYTRFNDGRSQ